MKLYKPIFPARGLAYSPTYKNSYNRMNNFSVVGQVFGEDNVCCKPDGTNVVPRIGGVCPIGYVSLYQKLGLKGHNGIDIPCIKETPVFASHKGTITRLSTDPSKGLGITITSDDGTFYTIYWHLMEIKVSIGQIVNALDLIGLADSTGYSVGNHLHFGKYDQPKNNGFDGASNPIVDIIEVPEFTFDSNLWFGLSGENVKNLQIALAYEGFLGQVGFYGFTGFFGLQTLDAVKRFQKKYGIISTGLVGTLTRTKLNEIFGKII